MKIDRNSPHIVVVDDDTRIRELLKQFLNDNGYLVSILKNTQEAAKFIETIKFEIMILDLMLPNETGLEFTQKIRQKSYNFPIIMLTAKGDLEDKIMGLELGADDYLVKPFEPRELLLRIKNILKRIKDNSEIIKFGNYSYNMHEKLLYQNDKILSLTNSEEALLNTLIENSNIVISRENLAHKLSINERSIDVQMARLRSKIDCTNIQTIRNKGYCFRI